MRKKSKVFEELKVIAHRNRGLANPHDVVNFARNPKTALHSQFEWRNGVAAEKWRLHQARNLIRVYVEVIEGSDKPIRAWASLPFDRTEAGGYRLTVDVLKDTDLRGQLLDMAYRDMEIFQLKYQRLTELSAVFSAMNKVRGKRRKTG